MPFRITHLPSSDKLCRTLSWPILEQFFPRQRLITTLLSPEQAPAQDLCLCYHERWEAEETIDETKNHQRLSQQPLRSRLPKLVLQELYALLLAHYAVRCLMLQAAQVGDLDPDRISFTMHTNLTPIG